MRAVTCLAWFAALTLAACSGNHSVVGGDAGSVNDLGAADVPVAVDVPPPMDTPDVPDVPPAMDAPDAVDAPPPDTGPARCAADGDCVGNAGGPACDVASGRCVTCTAASDRCPAGQYCVDATHSCAAGCRDDAACNATAADGGASGSRRCDTATHACVDCLTDAHCPSGTLCVGNLCVAGCNAGRPCPATQQCCAGACVDPQGNTSHCGACDNRCAVPNAASICLNGSCAVSSCVAPFGDCDGNAANGCESDTSRDVAHCGGCATACATRPNTVTTCAGGACAYACVAGFADCDGDTANGCESDTRTSLAHCGGCGVRCTPANATAACVAGACTVAACTGGYGDCDGNPANGCEADLPVSVSHCGVCGNRCPAPPNAAPVCVGGSCSSVCTAGFADCDSVGSTGCEVDVRTNLDHCGGCGRRCSGAGGTAACAAGSCTATCSAGRADCDANASNGCEVDLTTNRSHCGSCGVTCHANATCGATGCVCNPGYAGSGTVCEDVNECLTANGGCHANATCTNTIGGRTCACNEAFAGDGFTCAPIVIEITITASTTNYNAFLQAGAPVIPRVVRVTINPGVVVSSTSTVVPAFVSGGMRPGSELRIVNHGTITGAGGNGGNGGGYTTATPNPQSAGAPGGAALFVTVPVIIDNTDGNIWGGGGGGGGGAVATVTNVLAGGGGGGGGAGTLPGAGGARGPAFSGAQYPEGVPGSPGTATAGGAGGNGGNSGTWPNPFAGGRGRAGAGGAGGGPGQPGARGADGFVDGNLNASGMAGGAAGNAVSLNGNTVIWAAGNNGTQVRGPVN